MILTWWTRKTRLVTLKSKIIASCARKYPKDEVEKKVKKIIKDDFECPQIRSENF
jgi:hypothetical protein